MNLVFFVLKATGSGQKMAKTKVVQKKANWRRSVSKGQQTGQQFKRSPRRFFVNILICVHFLMQK